MAEVIFLKMTLNDALQSYATFKCENEVIGCKDARVEPQNIAFLANFAKRGYPGLLTGPGASKDTKFESLAV